MQQEPVTARTNAWLHAFFGGTVLLTGVIAAVGWSPWSTRWPAFVTLTVFALAYAAYGWRGYETPRAAVAFLPLFAVVGFVLPAVAPATAFVQCILFPLVWCQTERVRNAVLLSGVIGLASGIGLQVSGGPEALVGTILIETVSVVGACAMGIWMTRLAHLAEERRRLLEELRATQDSLAEAHRTAGVTSERERLAREIHDTVAQDLAGIVMLTERARGDLAAARINQLDERLSVLEDSARSALEESRTLVAAGASGTTGDSLAGALHRLAERHTRETGVPVVVEASECALDRDAQVVLLRVAQEALANVRAHAQAGSAHLHLVVDAEQVVLRITDDGVGFDTTGAFPGHGLRGLRDRLALAGGTCTITSAPGEGTTITVALPTPPSDTVDAHPLPARDEQLATPVLTGDTAVTATTPAPQPVQAPQ
ncbi:sensor histidine kinase [Curtobacterium sp. ISL-83]|uniref:sensor histidine kinase n=1 Tax=Curtobacterium sp. ISL-83 TaxID=2819145 RepID=UPI001BE5BEC9|nr:sensor histidine kinase [Curtobacterium sp. ISL-83]MBT2500965.1 sensor histidine kinase [Curtobacterium sp. ISL-83]